MLARSLRPAAYAVLASLSLCSKGAVTHGSSLTSFQQIFVDVGIVPGVIESFSGGALEVKFPGFAAPFTIGQGFTMEQTVGVPTFALQESLVPKFIGQTFVVIMVDPDAPSPQNHSHSDVRHFVGANFHLEATGKLTNSTPALSEFQDPHPTVPSTPHRYTLIAYVQPPGFVVAASAIIQANPSLTNFNFTSFAAETKLGDPVAATFFLTGSDQQPAHTTAGAKDGFTSAMIVPDVLPSFDPIAILDLSYPDINGSDFLVRMNENMSVPSVAPAPQILLSFNRSTVPQLARETFVLITVDPDAPTPQNTSISDVLHTLIADVRVTGDDDVFAPLSNTTAIAPYISPAPPVGSDPHRYTWLLFVQPPNFVERATPLVPADRTNFNFTSFREVTGLGSPVAGTFFRSGLNATLGE